MYSIYRHIRPDTNATFYIGKGKSGTNRQDSKQGRNEHWHNIVNKNDGEYEVEIQMTGLSHEEALDKEVRLIEFYGRSIDGGTLCNISIGGEHGYTGCKHSDETKEKMSKASKGKAKSVEHRANMDRANKKSAETRVYTDEWRKGLASHGMLGKKMSEESKAKMSQAQKGVPKPKGGKKPKGCIGTNIVTNEVKEFKSYMEAERYTSVNHNHIRKLIRGIGNQCKNWTFSK